MFQVDLNSDMGESFGAYRIGGDEQIIQSVSSANVACGFHAGDPMVMAKSVRMAKENGVSVGAHPGSPDFPQQLPPFSGSALPSLRPLHRTADPHDRKFPSPA